MKKSVRARERRHKTPPATSFTYSNSHLNSTKSTPSVRLRDPFLANPPAPPLPATARHTPLHRRPSHGSRQPWWGPWAATTRPYARGAVTTRRGALPASATPGGGSHGAAQRPVVRPLNSVTCCRRSHTGSAGRGRSGGRRRGRSAGMSAPAQPAGRLMGASPPPAGTPSW